jgi:predicted lipoprotein with Yx(FWY)xxD motif
VQPAQQKQSEEVYVKRIMLAVSPLALSTLPGIAAVVEPGLSWPTSKGQIWADAKGMTLYSFDKDTNVKSNCIDACAKEWPPLKPEKDSKATGKWTAIAPVDGSDMWVYDGHPLYTFLKDTKVGDAMGDNVSGFHIVK